MEEWENMPYIRKEDREKLNPILNQLAKALQSFPLENLDGVLNYCITYLLKSLYQPRYFNYNRAIGVLESAKLEFYRIVVAQYEDKKRLEHGDVEGYAGQ
ncbi:MAG: hypothetical protein OH337_04045 [Candidatus Parvarchaeota archaeon]|nr:hypothetical protein [Candidatus Haiyanarchaeum thermophilum]